jgi:hypothetical protein
MSASLLSSSGDAQVTGFDFLACSAGVDTRGGRLDVPRVKTVRWLEPGYAIVADLDDK